MTFGIGIESLQGKEQMMHAPIGKPAHRAFTLIELLVVIAIIGVLVSLLLPAVQKVREAANRTQCQNNLHQLGVALFNYNSTNRSFPPGISQGASVTAAHTWIAFILPYIEQENLYKLYNFNGAWSANDGLPTDSPPHTNGAKIPLLRCPSAPSKRTETTRAYTDYSATNLLHIAGDVIDTSRWDPMNATQMMAFNNGGVLAWNSTGTTASAITDGLSNTIAIAECAGRNLVFFNGSLVGSSDTIGAWADARLNTMTGVAGNMIVARGSSRATPQKGGPGAMCAVNCFNQEEIYAFHPGVANAAAADGSVRTLSANLDITILHALVTKAGNEPNPSDF